ncbi:hypothetical protein [Nitrosomonas sp. Is37]|uniref:hypothetical protein n=1 Tax=Nitrosomonas sp. Is37 TaxID=3080535 RepID=UPI00294B2971|nr:hypothetical protein [Nitrosomonas sp. Is37]MDV6343776.1 hypothetical protein [Nitrosomonas sp. Is37]
MVNHDTMRQADVEGNYAMLENFNVLDIVESDNLKEIEKITMIDGLTGMPGWKRCWHALEGIA